jgi:hypothetical protein
MTREEFADQEPECMWPFLSIQPRDFCPACGSGDIGESDKYDGSTVCFECGEEFDDE